MDVKIVCLDNLQLNHHIDRRLLPISHRFHSSKPIEFSPQLPAFLRESTSKLSKPTDRALRDLETFQRTLTDWNYIKEGLDVTKTSIRHHSLPEPLIQNPPVVEKVQLAISTKVEVDPQPTRSDPESGKPVISLVAKADFQPSIMNELPKAWQDAITSMIDDPTGAMSTEFTDHMSQFLKAYEYKGFDPVKIRVTLAMNHAKMQTGQTLWLSETASPVVAGAGTFNLLVSFLVALFNVRGNNLTAIRDGLPKPGQTSFDRVFQTLKIKAKVIEEGKAKSSETLTLARINAAFPVHSLNIVCRDEFTRVIVDLSDIGLKRDKLGKVLSHPVVASVLTVGHKKDGFAALTFLASLRLNKIIGGKSKTSMAQLWLFHKAALNSSAVTEAVKEGFWEDKWDQDVARDALDRAKLALRTMLAEEPEVLAEALSPF